MLAFIVILLRQEAAGFGRGFDDFFVVYRRNEPYLSEESLGFVLPFNARVPRYALLELRMI